jgi:mRNA interferase RelE/StbE
VDTTKYLAKQEKAVQERITQALRGILATPLQGDIGPMKGDPGKLRLKVGSFRVLFRLDKSDKVMTMHHLHEQYN